MMVLNDGSSITALAASCRYVSAGAGVPLGATSRYQTPLATSHPASFAVGVSGNAAWRERWNITSARILLPSTSGFASPGCATTASMCLPSSAGEDCPARVRHRGELRARSEYQFLEIEV